MVLRRAWVILGMRLVILLMVLRVVVWALVVFDWMFGDLGSDFGGAGFCGFGLDFL